MKQDLLDFKLKSLEGILKWAWNRFENKVVASSSFQTQSVPLLHMISRVTPEMTILFLDTGFHFQETLEFMEHLRDLFQLNIRIIKPEMRKAELFREIGVKPYKKDPDRCCYINKVLPMRRVMRNYSAVVFGVRRDQTSVRKELSAIQRDYSGVLRIHPKLEYFIVDGGSSDETLDIIKKYDDFINWWKSDRDFGQSHALNIGFSRATGEFVNWVNSDDILLQNAFHHLINLYQKRRTGLYYLAGSGYKRNGEGEIIGKKELASKVNNLIFDFSNPYKGGTQQSWFWSLQLYREAGGINPIIRYPMDEDLYIKMSYLRPEIITTKEYLAAVRRHSTAKSVADSYPMALEKKYLFTFYSKLCKTNKNALNIHITSHLLRARHYNNSILKRLFIILEVIIRTPKRLIELPVLQRFITLLFKG